MTFDYESKFGASGGHIISLWNHYKYSHLKKNVLQFHTHLFKDLKDLRAMLYWPKFLLSYKTIHVIVGYDVIFLRWKHFGQ